MSIAPIPNAVAVKVELEIDPRIAEKLKQDSSLAISAAKNALTKPAQELSAAACINTPRPAVDAAVEGACDASAQLTEKVAHKAIDATCGADGLCINVIRWAVKKFTLPQQ